MSIKQGLKYNSPESKADIPTFVAYHKLNVDEIKEPLDSFSRLWHRIGLCRSIHID
jgi:phosphatidylserine decarboxylase